MSTHNMFLWRSKKISVILYAPAIQRMVERAYSVIPSIYLSVRLSVHGRDGISNMRLSFSGISNLR